MLQGQREVHLPRTKNHIFGSHPIHFQELTAEIFLLFSYSFFLFVFSSASVLRWLWCFYLAVGLLPDPSYNCAVFLSFPAIADLLFHNVSVLKMP